MRAMESHSAAGSQGKVGAAGQPPGAGGFGVGKLIGAGEPGTHSQKYGHARELSAWSSSWGEFCFRSGFRVGNGGGGLAHRKLTLTACPIRAASAISGQLRLSAARIASRSGWVTMIVAGAADCDCVPYRQGGSVGAGVVL